MAEQARINRDYPGKAFFTPDGYLAPEDEELCQYEVQLTRSLGHKLLKEFGITHEPDIRQRDISDKENFALVLCSDGVTDELQPKEISERVARAGSVEEVCGFSSKV